MKKKQKELALSLKQAYEDGADVVLALEYLWEHGERENKWLKYTLAGEKEQPIFPDSQHNKKVEEILEAAKQVIEMEIDVASNEEEKVLLPQWVYHDIDVMKEQGEQFALVSQRPLLLAADILSVLDHHGRGEEAIPLPNQCFPQTMTMRRYGYGNSYVHLTKYELEDIKQLFPRGYCFEQIVPIGIEYKLVVAQRSTDLTAIHIAFDSGSERIDMTDILDEEGKGSYTLKQIWNTRRFDLESRHWSRGGQIIYGLYMDLGPEVYWSVEWSLTVECSVQRRIKEKRPKKPVLYVIDDVSLRMLDFLDLRAYASFACTSKRNAKWVANSLSADNRDEYGVPKDPLIDIMMEQYRNVISGQIRCNGVICQKSVGSRVQHCHLCDPEETHHGVGIVREIKSLLRSMTKLYARWDPLDNMNYSEVERITKLLLPAQTDMNLVQRIHYLSVCLRHLEYDDYDKLLIWMKQCYEVQLKLRKRDKNMCEIKTLINCPAPWLPYEEDEWFEALKKWKKDHAGNLWSDEVFHHVQKQRIQAKDAKS